MRPPRIACALLSCLALATYAKEATPAGEFLWEVEVEGRVMAAAAMDAQRVIFGTVSDSAVAPESTLYCLDRTDGSSFWSRPFPNWLLACPVVTATRIYVGCDDTKLYCLDKATGEEIWHFPTAGRIDSTPCIDTPGNCYFGSRDRFFYAVDPGGNRLWSRFLKGPVASSPILDEREGRIYVADLANTIYAFTLAGELLWSYKPRLADINGLRLRIYSSPALDDERFLYVGSGDHHLYAIDRDTGFLFWREDTGAIVDASPVISADEFLYVANRDGVLFKYGIEPLNAEREVWRNESIGQVFYSSPTVDATNNIYICGAPPLDDPEADEPKTQLSYVDRHTGNILWSQLIPGYTDATPVLDEEGNVYLGTAGGKFVKIRGAGAGLADSPWPTFRGQPMGHGRYEETFSQWLAGFGIPPELGSTNRDSDGDGFFDYEEFVLGSHPRDPLDRPRRAPAVFTANGQDTKLSFQLQKGLRAPYTLQKSSNLLDWTEFTLAPEAFQFEDEGATWQIQTRIEHPGVSGVKFHRVFWERR